MKFWGHSEPFLEFQCESEVTPSVSASEWWWSHEWAVDPDNSEFYTATVNTIQIQFWHPQLVMDVFSRYLN